MSDWRKEAEPVTDWRSEAERVDPRAPTAPMTTEQGEALKNAQTKESALETALTFFGNGGPTAALRGAMHATAPQGPPGVPTNARPGEGLLEHYRRVRDETTRDLGSAGRRGPQMEAFGVKFNPVALAGAAAPTIMAPNPVSFVGRLGLGGLLGASQAGIHSRSDLTKGEVVPFLKDVGEGFDLGGATTGVAEGFTAPMRAISRGAASRIGDAASGQAARDAAAVADEIASTRGLLGAESTKAGLMRRNMLGAIDEVPPNFRPGSSGAVSDTARADALAALKDPEAVRLAEKTLSRNRVEYPAQVSKIQGLESDLASKVANADREAANRTRDYFKQSTWKTEVKPRLSTLGENALLGAGAGAVTGGATGMVSSIAGATPMQSMLSGIISGVGTSALSGGSGLKTLAKNAMASPRMQASALETLIGASQAGQKALQKGANTASSRLGEQAGERPKDLSQYEEDAIQAFLGASP